MPAKLSKIDMKRVIDLRKQRIISPAADRMSLVNRRKRPLSQSLIQELSQTFEKIGVDTKKLEGIAKRDQRERLRFYKKERANAKKVLAAIKHPFRYGIEERRKAFELLSGITLPQQAQAQTVVLDEASAIAFSPGLGDFSQEQPWNNLARLQFEIDGDTGGGVVDKEVDFAFVWQNTYGQDVMINAQTLAMAKGFCDTWTVPLYGPDESADGGLTFWTEFDIFELWNSPFTSPLLESGQSAEFASTWVDWVRIYYFLDIGNTSSGATVLRTWPLQHEGYFTVPVDGKVVFLVSFLFSVIQGLFDAEIGSGADFSTNGNFVMCPFVWINVLIPN